jgi:hypothetical protein
MSDEFEFFSNDFNNWNYNPFINTPDADPYVNFGNFYRFFHKLIFKELKGGGKGWSSYMK